MNEGLGEEEWTTTRDGGGEKRFVQRASAAKGKRQSCDELSEPRMTGRETETEERATACKAPSRKPGVSLGSSSQSTMEAGTARARHRWASGGETVWIRYVRYRTAGRINSSRRYQTCVPAPVSLFWGGDGVNGSERVEMGLET